MLSGADALTQGVGGRIDQINTGYITPIPQKISITILTIVFLEENQQETEW